MLGVKGVQLNIIHLVAVKLIKQYLVRVVWQRCSLWYNRLWFYNYRTLFWFFFHLASTFYILKSLSSSTFPLHSAAVLNAAVLFITHQHLLNQAEKYSFLSCDVLDHVLLNNQIKESLLSNTKYWSHLSERQQQNSNVRVMLQGKTFTSMNVNSGLKSIDRQHVPLLTLLLLLHPLVFNVKDFIDCINLSNTIFR